jgi:hypothetical protein
VHFTGGPAHGAIRELPAEPDGRPPVRWILSQRDTPSGPELNHLYERGDRDESGKWTMRFVRSDPIGMTE